jgi:hypothetical protein
LLVRVEEHVVEDDAVDLGAVREGEAHEAKDLHDERVGVALKVLVVLGQHLEEGENLSGSGTR